jgi:outer membrane protein TolC
MKATSHATSQRKSRVVIAGLLLLWTAATGASNAGAETITLSEAVRTALEQNDELKAQRSAHAARLAEIGIVRSALLPKIFLEERYLRTANPTYAFMTRLNQQRIGMADFAPDVLNRPDAVSDFQTTLSIEQPLYVRKIHVGVEMSKREAEASEELLQRKTEEIAFRVVRAYLGAGTAAGYARVAEKALADALEHQRLATLRYETGFGLYSDTLRAGTAVAEAQQRLVSARKQLTVSQKALGLLIGCDRPVDVTARIPALPIRERTELSSRSLARRDVKALELRKANAENQVKLAEAGNFPSLGVGGSYQFNDHNIPAGREGESWQVMAFLKWELFDGAKSRHEKTRAGHQVSEAEAYLEGMKKRVSFELDEAWLTLDEASRNLDLARAALKTAEEGRRLVRVRYEGALSPIVDMLDAQLAYDHTAANLVARENDFTLAIAALSHAGGTLLLDLQLEEQTGRSR